MEETLIASTLLEAMCVAAEWVTLEILWLAVLILMSVPIQNGILAMSWISLMESAQICAAGIPKTSQALKNTISMMALPMCFSFLFQDKELTKGDYPPIFLKLFLGMVISSANYKSWFGRKLTNASREG